MGLIDKITELRRLTSASTDNQILRGVEDVILQKIVYESNCNDSYLSKRLTLLESIANKLAVDYSDDWASFHTEYFETLVYLSLRKFLCVEKVSEKNVKEPDFKIIINGITYYIECKAFTVEAPKKLYTNDQDGARKGKKELDEQAQLGKKICMTSREVQCYDPDKKGYDSSSTLMCIERLLQKIDQNYKPDQFKYPNTLMFLDISQLLFTNHRLLSLLPIYQANERNSSYVTNGELWNIAFGRKDTPIFSPKEAFDKGSLCGHLSRDGVMYWNANICGIVFRTWFDNFFLEPLGLIRDIEHLPTMLETINCQFNNENNSYGYKFYDKK